VVWRNEEKRGDTKESGENEDPDDKFKTAEEFERDVVNYIKKEILQRQDLSDLEKEYHIKRKLE
jgi:hypothetical protein